MSGRSGIVHPPSLVRSPKMEILRCCLDEEPPAMA